MTPNQVVELLGIFGAEDIEIRGAKIHSSCPLARWTHAGGTDGHPSFGIYRSSHGNLRYKCLACGAAGSMRGLYWQMMTHGGSWFPLANQLVYEEAERSSEAAAKQHRLEYRPGGALVGEAGIRRLADWKPGPMPSGVTETLWEDMTPKGEAVHYDLPAPETFDWWHRQPIPEHALKRGVTPEMWERWGMGYDPNRHRWIFVCRDKNREIVGYTGRICWDADHCFRCGRSIVDKEKSEKRGKKVHMHKCECCRQSYVKYWNFPGMWRRSSVYGIHLYEGGSVVILEGSTDCSRLQQFGVKNPMGVFGAQVNPDQLDLIFELSCPIVVAGDGDKAGRELNSAIEAQCKRAGRSCELVTIPDGTDPGALTEQEIRALFPDHAFLI